MKLEIVSFFASEEVAPPTLELEAVSKSFPHPRPRQVLAEISLSIEPGAFVTIVGRSGSGKSTLLNLVGLLDEPTSGRYRIDGQDVSQRSSNQLAFLRARHFGFVFQDFALFEEFSVVDNVVAGMLAQRLRSVRAARRHAKHTLANLGLSHLLNSDAVTLSGGERQRLAIARALVGGQSVLICDEPTGNLDRRTEQQVVDLLLRVHARGSTVIAATHNPEIAALGTDQWKIDDGRAVAQ